MMKSNHHSPGSRGYSLLEVIMYVVILGALLVLTVNILMVMLRSFAGFQLIRELNQSAIVSLDRWSRAVHEATSVDAINSVLGTHPGHLILNTTAVDGSPATLEFFLNNQTMMIKAGGVTASSTSQQGALSTLVFRQINTPHSQAVRVELTLEARRAGLRRTGVYTTTAILRGSY